jgi:iron(II)-dependent oxidoreductase
MRHLVLLLALLVAGACSKPPEEIPGMAYIPAGEYLRGSRADDARVYPWEQPREQPQHPVRLNAFYIDLREVTNAEFERFLPTHPRDTGHSPCDDCPVTEVTWFQASDYCAAQSKRLPTEAEWEKAAKGGRDEWYPEPYEEYVWFSKNTIKRTQPVGQKLPNPYGLYDMLGNVRKWTADWYAPDYYQLKERDNPKGPKEGARRSERGGAFFLPARGVTATIRYNHPPTFTLYFLGFRCARDAK